MYVDPDIAVSLSRPEALPAKAFGDEANIAYVAFTRAIGELYLPQDFKGILTSEWQQAMKRYETVQNPKTYRTPQQKREQRVNGFSGRRSIQLMNETQKPKPQRKKVYKLGDRVRTNHGEGSIVDVDGDKYLVDLDGQAACLWAKGWDIKKV